MNKTWALCKIQDLIARGEAELKTGPFGTQLHASDYVETGTPVINVRNIGFGKIKEENIEFISEKTVQRLQSHLLQAEDIVFGRKGAVERHALIQEKHVRWFQGSDCLRLRIKAPQVVPQFLSYYFQTEYHKQWMMKQCSHGSTMTSLNQDIISRISFLLPPNPIQHKIVTILSAYDDLIENNTRRIAILEEIAQSIYQEWFVHFRYPGHEKNKMVESELGMIPEEWTVEKLGSTLTLQRGFDLPTTQRQKGNIPVYASTGPVGTHNQAKVKGPGVLTGRSGSLGTVAYVKEDFWPLNTTLWVKDFHSVTPTYAFYLLRSIDLTVLNSGAAVPTLDRNNVHKTLIVIPPYEIIKKFDSYISTIFDLKIKLNKKNINLHLTRDLLLPKLISGEIDAEALNIEIPEVIESEEQQDVPITAQSESVKATQLALPLL